MTKSTRVSGGMARRATALAFAVSTVLGNAALAAETTTALEEIVVTAERRPQSLQDIPTSATVLSGDTLAKEGVKNIIDIQRVAPSVAINTYNRGTFINIRGVGIAQSAPTSVPGVATYIDGVYIPHETFIAQSFYDIGSIEVLRGPQGTLTGQNSTGGAVYMRTPAVDMEKFSGYVDQTIGQYSWYRTVAAVNIPMGGIVGARVSATYNKTDSYTTNIGGPSEPGSNKLKAARADVHVQPLDILNFDLRYEHFQLDSGYNAVKNRFDVVTNDPFTIEENANSFLNQDGYRASVEGKWDITSGMQLRAITSKFSADNIDQADGDRRTTVALPPPAPPNPTGPARVSYTTQTTTTRVTEVNLLSTGEHMFNWVVGAFYMSESIPVQVLRDTTSNGGNPVTFITPAPGSSIIANAENKSKSGFGEFDVRFTDMFELDTGVRYSKDTQDYTRYAIPGPPPPGCFPCTSTAESSKTTGRIGGKMFLSQDMMAYLTVSRGYKAGGVNLDPRLDVFGPETNTVEELGIKSTVADGRLRVNGDVYYSDYKDIKIAALVNLPGGVRVPSTVNGPRAKIYGAELEVVGQFDAVALNAGLSVMHSETTETQTMTNSAVTPSADLPVFSGTELPFSPKVTFNAGAEYAMKVGNGTLTPRVQANYLGEQWATFFHDDRLTRVPSHVVADFRITYAPIEQLQIEGFVNNLFDKTYIAVQVQESSSAAGGYMFGAPRQIGGRVTYKF